MTYPPNGPGGAPDDPERPATRPLEPIHPGDDYGAYPPQESGASLSQAYSESVPEPVGYGAPPPPAETSRNRTIALAVLALLALILLVVALVLVFTGGDDEQPAVPGAQTSEAATTSRTTTTRTTTTTPTTTTETTRTAPPAAGVVVYALSGDGDVTALTFTENGRNTVVPFTGPPWSQRVDAGAASATLNALVVRGQVTCTISVDGEVVSEATSGIGPLRCSAAVPQ